MLNCSVPAFQQHCIASHVSQVTFKWQVLVPPTYHLEYCWHSFPLLTCCSHSIHCYYYCFNQLYFISVKNEENQDFIPLFIPSPTLFFMWMWIPNLHHFLSLWRISLNFFCRSGLLVMNSVLVWLRNFLFILLIYLFTTALLRYNWHTKYCTF